MRGTGRRCWGGCTRTRKKLTGPDAKREQLLRSVRTASSSSTRSTRSARTSAREPNVRGIVAQEALLTLMENENVEFEVDGEMLAVNSSTILFVAGGAFEELYDACCAAPRSDRTPRR